MNDWSNYAIPKGVKRIKKIESFQSISSISQKETKSPAILKSSISTDVTGGHSSDWLHQLRATINAAISKPAPSFHEISPVDTKEYDRIVQNEKELEKKIRSIALEPLLEKKIIPQEEVIYPICFSYF